MKKALLLCLVLYAGLGAGAQTWEEWFQQKETQKKYLLQQIAALKAYLDYARQGYEVAREGWDLIQGIKKGDRDLHEEYFRSLTSVHPRVEESPYLAAALALHDRMVRQAGSALRRCAAPGALTSGELSYCRQVVEGVVQSDRTALTQLESLTTAGALTLTDAERLSRIEKLYREVQDRYTFLNTFCREMNGLLAWRLRAQVETLPLEKMQGIK